MDGNDEREIVQGGGDMLRQYISNRTQNHPHHQPSLPLPLCLYLLSCTCCFLLLQFCEKRVTLRVKGPPLLTQLGAILFNECNKNSSKVFSTTHKIYLLRYFFPFQTLTLFRVQKFYLDVNSDVRVNFGYDTLSWVNFDFYIYVNNILVL